MPFITDHGLQIYYREERPPRRASSQGIAGPRALLFIPGDTASSACLTAELRYFGHRYRSLALDPPGTGRSQRLGVWPADWWSLAASAATSLMEQLELAPSVIVGSGDGSLTALLMAAEQPHLVCGVVADSCPPALSASDLMTGAAARRRVLGTWRADEERSLCAARPWGRWRPRMERWSRSSFWRRAHGRDWRAVVAADADLRERLARGGGLDLLGGNVAELGCPILLTGSIEDDQLAELGPRLETVARRMPRAQLFLWPEGGHPLMWTAPTAFRRAVDDFLTDVCDALSGTHPAAPAAGDALDLR